MSKDNLLDWEDVLSSAAHLQELLSGAVLVGGTAAAIYTAVGSSIICTSSI